MTADRTALDPIPLFSRWTIVGVLAGLMAAAPLLLRWGVPPESPGQKAVLGFVFFAVMLLVEGAFAWRRMSAEIPGSYLRIFLPIALTAAVAFALVFGYVSPVLPRIEGVVESLGGLLCGIGGGWVPGCG